MIYERIRAIIADTGLPKELWAEIAGAVAHLKNRSPTSALRGMTPYEALYGERPDVSYLVTIGTKAFVHVTKKRTRKLGPRNFEGIMVGHGRSHRYRLWIPDKQNQGIPRHPFCEKQQGIWSKLEQWEDTMTQDSMVMPYHSDVVPHDDKARKERIIYDTIEVLPPPRNKPVSESESESDTEDDESGETSDGGGDGDGSESDARDDNGAMQEPTIETESLCFHHQRIPMLRSQLSASENRNPRPLIQNHMFRLKTKPQNAKRNLTSHTPSKLP